MNSGTAINPNDDYDDEHLKDFKGHFRDLFSNMPFYSHFTQEEHVFMTLRIRGYFEELAETAFIWFLIDAVLSPKPSSAGRRVLFLSVARLPNYFRDFYR